MKNKDISPLRFLSVLFFLLLAPSLFSQTYYALQIDRNIRFKAADITAKYQPRLVMGPEQALEFQSTVARFLVKKKAVVEDDTLSPMAKYELLKQLSSRETSEMADVLESYRWQEYMRIKNEIQPIPKPEKAIELKDAIVIH
ncbi:hypothetical protein [Maribacter luteus]|uniref:Uncharacterized protein n=1 Tax=Maribacter luteus TaxID=2594478 RepID=A0A6I2MPY7_9FLAO|nr:hypothetical protein [Maribacter luteus]MRX65901.1 hypothetical protein [Maribacter luteus]